MAKIVQVPVPDLGDFDLVEVVEVLVHPGDSVAVEDSLITLESDKASMEVPAPAAGKVVAVQVSPGDKIGPGALILTLEVAEDSASAEAKPAPAAAATAAAPAAPVKSAPKAAPVAETQVEETQAAETPAAETQAAETQPPAAPPAATPAATPAPAPASAPTAAVDETTFAAAHASPAVRRYARELGVDLGRVRGSGRKGRILQEDVQAFVKTAVASSAAPAAASAGGFSLPAAPTIDFSKFGDIEVRPLSRIRKISGVHLQRAWITVPHVTQFDEADITELEAFRKAQGEEAKARGVKLTPVAFQLKACARALQEFPEVASSLSPDGESLILKKYIHIGVAVDTPNGLVVPVLRDVDRKSLFELAAELGEVSGRARDGKLTPKDLSGGCFSISSLGGIGGVGFTPIVNAPEVAILGVARASWKPVYDGSTFVPRLILPFSLSYDHRVIDGASAVRFTTYLAGLLGEIRRLLL